MTINHPAAQLRPRRGCAKSVRQKIIRRSVISAAPKRHRARSAVTFFVALSACAVSVAAPVAAGPAACDNADCTPGIIPHVVLGAPCDNSTYYVFGTADYNVSFATQPGRLMFCGSPRRFEPRWFRSPPMVGVKAENSDCADWPEYYVAQAPDGLFLVCIVQNGKPRWTRGDT